MHTSLRAAISALALAGAMALIPIANATAGGGCRGDEEGEGRVLGVGPAARDAAVGAAIHDWKREVREDCGYWPHWRNSSHREVRCEVERGGYTECEVEAVPHG